MFPIRWGIIRTYTGRRLACRSCGVQLLCPTRASRLLGCGYLALGAPVCTRVQVQGTILPELNNLQGQRSHVMTCRKNTASCIDYAAYTALRLSPEGAYGGEHSLKIPNMFPQNRSAVMAVEKRRFPAHVLPHRPSQPKTTAVPGFIRNLPQYPACTWHGPCSGFDDGDNQGDFCLTLWGRNVQIASPSWP